MKLPIDWLKEFVHIDKTPHQIGDIFTMLGFETESVENEVIDLEITPNRGDALSVYGLAREYAAATNQRLSSLDIEDIKFLNELKSIKITNNVPELLTRHSGMLITVDQVKPSSEKIQRRLQSVGMRPINNIVDITNYVMVELGLPLHAFDLDQIKNSAMVFRLSRDSEPIQTIDERTHHLPEGIVVVENQNRMIDLVGIMGATNSSIRPATKRILVHCPIIDPKIIRQTTKQLGIMTDAAYRFERLVDFGMATTALKKAWQLIQRESSARLTEAFDRVYQNPTQRRITLSIEEVHKTLGTKISDDEAQDYLTRLGFTVTQEKIDIHVQVPTWRTGDVKYPVDVIEEIARLYGYEKIPRIPLPNFETKNRANNGLTLKFKIARWLIEQGFQEVLTPTFVSEQEIKSLDYKPGYQYSIQSLADNPDTRYLRPSMIITLAKVLVRNNWYGQLKLFEIGETFAEKYEQSKVCIAQTGNQKKYWAQYVPESAIQVINSDHPLAKQIKLRTTVTFVETDIEIFKEHVKDVTVSEPTLTKVNYRPYSKFTPLVRDIALIVDESTSAREISEVIASIDEKIFLVDVFDEFKSDRFGAAKISRAFHVIFDDPKSSIVESVVNSIWAKIVKIVHQNGWVIRE